MIKDISQRLFSRHLLSRRLFLSGLISGVGSSVWAGAPATSVRPKARPKLRPTDVRKVNAPSVRSLIQSAKLSGQVSFGVADAKTGVVLEGHHPALGLPPASVTKALTAMYALEALGPAHQFETQILTTGGMENGILDGDLVLAGGGDPTLDTNALASMASDLRKQGVKEVRGRFLVYGGALPKIKTIDPEQPDEVGYSPAISGLSLNYNRVRFGWKRSGNGYGVTMEARSSRYQPVVNVAEMKIVDRQMPVYTYRSQGGRDIWTVARGALGKRGARWLPVRNPEIYAGEVFGIFAQSQGIALKAPKTVSTVPLGSVLVRHKSKDLTSILRGMLKYSTNVTAEMVGLAASQARGVDITTLKQSAREASRWADHSMGMKNANLVDHSGLGAASRLHTGELASALAQAKQRGALQPILKEFKLRHKNGSVNKSHPVKVHAKTGTLNFVSGLAGYMRAHDGTELAFAIFVADPSAREKLMRQDRARPKGARSWNRKAKRLQQNLIERWDRIYGA